MGDSDGDAAADHAGAGRVRRPGRRPFNERSAAARHDHEHYPCRVHRPLRPPPARSSCPTAPTHQDLKPVLATGLAPGKPPAGPDYGYGDGPVYLSGQYDFYPGGWDNAIWLVEPAATGPLLIRGQQLKGSARATFSRQSDEYGKPSGPAPGKPVSTQSAYGMSVPFYSELDLVGAEPPYWGAYFADTHFDAAGCYFIQVDGTTFSELILVEVPDAARPPA